MEGASFVERLPLARAALGYAERRHAGQRRRSDHAPFIQHPLEVARLLHEAGAGEELVAAGVLHDVIEKTTVTRRELRARFGERIAELVEAVSENPAIEPYAKRKAALRDQVAAADDAALMLFAADKLSKVRELRVAGLRAPKRRLAHYSDSLELLRSRRPHCSLTAQLTVELAGLQQRLTPARQA